MHGQCSPAWSLGIGVTAGACRAALFAAQYRTRHKGAERVDTIRLVKVAAATSHQTPRSRRLQ